MSHRFDKTGTPFPSHKVSVAVGTHQRNEYAPWQRHKVLKFVIHEKYKPLRTRNDVMLLKVSPRIKYSDKVKPICVDGSVFPDGRICLVTGWGDTDTSGRTYLTWYLTSDGLPGQSIWEA